MAYENTMESQPGSSAVGRPLVTSYDLGYEYSLQHYIEVKCLVEEADRECHRLRHTWHRQRLLSRVLTHQSRSEPHPAFQVLETRTELSLSHLGSLSRPIIVQ